MVILQTELGLSRGFGCFVGCERDEADWCIISGVACRHVQKQSSLICCLFFRKAISRSGLHYLGPPQPTLPPASNGPSKELRACVDWTVSHTHSHTDSKVSLLMCSVVHLCWKIRLKHEELQKLHGKIWAAVSLPCLAESLHDIWISRLFFFFFSAAICSRGSNKQQFSPLYD